MNARPRTDREALDDAAFDRLVHTHRASLERFTQQLGASREDAEEIAATALLRAYQSPPGRLGVDWRPWLRTVARNLWIDMRRRRAVHLVPDEGALERVPSTAQTVDQIAATAEEAREICAAIALLPAPQRAAIYLREVRGLSYDEIAVELGITLAAVTSNLHRARQSVSPTTSRRVPARIEHPGAAPSAGHASPALTYGAGSSVLAPSSATPHTVSDAATPATAGSAPPASPPATIPSAPPTVAGGPAPAQVPPVDTRKAKAPAVSPGRSASAPGRSSSGTAQSSRASATGQQHRNAAAAKASAMSRKRSQAATKASKAGAAGPPAEADPPANDAHPTGPAHATGPPSKANAATP